MLWKLVKETGTGSYGPLAAYSEAEQDSGGIAWWGNGCSSLLSDLRVLNEPQLPPAVTDSVLSFVWSQMEKYFRNSLLLLEITMSVETWENF